MEHTSHSQPGGPAPWAYETDQDHLAQPTVLLVEDERDIREMVATLLEMARSRTPRPRLPIHHSRYGRR